MSMDPVDPQLRREILDDVGALLREHLASEHWGRVLVQVVAGPGGQPVVAGMEVEDIVGDGARVDAVFGSDAVRPLLPVLAMATEALCGLEGVELDAVGGGTFLRQRAGGFQWLPGLVRMPSDALERAWDEVCARLDARQQALQETHGLGTHDGLEIDLELERIVLSSGGRPQVEGRATLLGTFSRASRTWGWASTNPLLPEGVRRASSALLDAIVEREPWELSTPVFPADEPTVRALCAFVCDRAGGQGIYRLEREDGVAIVLLRDVRRV